MNRYRSGTRWRTRAALASIAAITTVTMFGLPGAGAAEPAAAPDMVNQPDRGMIYDGLDQVPTKTCETGLRVRGTNLCTHGPDLAPPGVDIHKSATPVRDPAKPDAAECNGDGISGLRTQVIYARSSDVADRFAAFAASLRTWAEGVDEIYNSSAGETGGSRHVRFVHDASCNIIVATAVMSPTGDDNFSNTITELQALGFNRTDRKYMVFTDAYVYCGIGNIIGDEQPGPDNANTGGPSYGRTDAGCWDTGVAAHEHMHNLGGVQLSAPHSSGGWHCVDEWDRMCYSDSPYYPPMQILCGDSAHDSRFDCNHDDYYSTNPPNGNYLKTHWNTANSLFLTGGGKWGYVWADQPTAASYVPSTFYQRNSSGATNTITRNGQGYYTVRFPNIGLVGGTVNVTAYGSTSHMCKVGSWGSSGSDQLVNVRCFTNTGVLADTLFTASFTGTVQNPGEIGYAWANQPSALSYTPSTTYQFNSTGAVNTIARNNIGNYTVVMPGLGAASAGHVKVTAYGFDDSSNCKVGSWSQNLGNRTINVLCFTAAGAPVDTYYTVTYVNNIGILGVPGAASAYVWANQPTASPYTPSTFYQFNSTGALNTITRNGIGFYTVHLPGLAVNNGHVQATAYGGSTDRCKVTSWYAVGGELLVNILCTNPAGTPVDTYYTASYTR